MLNNIGLPGLLLIAVVVLVMFGRGKVSSLMGEVGKGITAFKRGVKDGSAELEDAADDRHNPPHNQVTGQIPGQPLPGQHIPGQHVPGQTIQGQAVPGQTVPGQTVLGQTVRDVTPPSDRI